MYTALMKTSEPKYKLNLPQNFSSKKIIHYGIQYAEPLIEFAGQLPGETFQDFHPMRGLKQNKPYDYSLNGNVFDPEINLAVICANSKSEQLHSFLNRLHSSSPAGNNNPDYLIDYPGFNLRIAEWAKAQGIRVFYYISPQIWAWHTSRVHNIKKCALD